MFDKFWKENEKAILDDFFTFLKFQSISSESEKSGEVAACAGWLMEKVQGLNFQTELWQTKSHPIIFAKSPNFDQNLPTLLIYNHYDVQPEDPIDLWTSPPFEPQIRDGQIFARGAQDNKGQLFYVFQALNYLMSIKQSLPINIKWIIEGEEETGSYGLESILKEKSHDLKADFLAIVDLGIPSMDRPAITLGCRGIVTLDLTVIGAKTDLHSGSNGGIVFNPSHALVEMLAKLRDSSGKITVPGFYDDIKPLDPDEQKRLDLTFDEADYLNKFGAKATGGEQAFSPYERAWIRPTLEVNGICGGYTGSGFKTVIPAKAHAKISARLVPGQDPHKTLNQIKEHLISLAPDGIEVIVDCHEGVGSAVRSDANSKVVQAFKRAYTEVFNKEIGYIFEGGSIPVINALAEASDSQAALVGLGLPDDNMHAPNEHFGIDRLKLGTQILTKAIDYLSKR